MKNQHFNVALPNNHLRQAEKEIIYYAKMPVTAFIIAILP